MADRYVVVDRLIVRRLVERQGMSPTLLRRLTGLGRTTIYKVLAPNGPTTVMMSDRVARSLAAGLGVRPSVFATPVTDLLAHVE